MIIDVGQTLFAGGVVYHVEEVIADRPTCTVLTVSRVDDRSVLVVVKIAKNSESRDAIIESWHRHASISHRGIVAAKLIDDDSGSQLLMMPHLRRVEPHVLARESAVSVVERFLSVLDALATLHSAGRTHGDVKPANLLLNDDDNSHFLLTDFAPICVDDGVQFGTARYWAPERFRGAPASSSTDVFAAALTLFVLLAGHHPFCDETIPDVRAYIAQRGRHIPRISASQDPLSAFGPRVDAVMMHALAFEPYERLKDAGAFAVALRRALRPSLRLRNAPVFGEDACRHDGGHHE